METSNKQAVVYVSQTDRAVAYWKLTELLNRFLSLNEQGEIVPLVSLTYKDTLLLSDLLTKVFK
jgi:hypothetical protein